MFNITKQTVFGKVTVTTRTDACPYLEYKVDMYNGHYNLYHCGLEGTKFGCQRYVDMEWCPMRDENKNTDKRIYIMHDELNTGTVL